MPDEPVRHLHVDGEDFVIILRVDEPGVHDITWTSGRHEPPYGFTTATSSRQALTEPELRSAISDFLADINPETGYLD